MRTKIPTGALLAVALATATSIRASSQGVALDARQLVRDVEVLAADSMEGRRAGTPGSLKARAYIVERFKEAGIRPLGASYEHPFSVAANGRSASVSGTNVVGVIRGRGAPDLYLAVTAHYDHLGVRNGQIFNGADDNASGVAALLAIAAHFSRNPPEHSILFAALDAEESGLNGARALVEGGPVSKGAIALNVNIDMIGRDPRNVLYAAGTAHYPFLKRYLSGVAQPPIELRFGHDVPNTKEEDWTRDSDQFEFHRAGIPFVYFGVEDYDQHHKPTDDAETIQREFMAAAAQTIAVAIHRFDTSLQAIRLRR